MLRLLGVFYEGDERAIDMTRGNVLGDDALAAIGASTALFSLTVGITNDNLVRYCTDCCDWFLQCI